MKKVLTTADLGEARRLREQGWSYKNIGARFGVTGSCVWNRLNPETKTRRLQSLTGRCNQAKRMAAWAANKGGYAPIKASVYEMEVAFTGNCFLCGVPEEECTRRLHADHDHTTGEFRGWACQRCNVLIGQIETYPDLIDKFTYLFPKPEPDFCELKHNV